jgi:hypothetical protein
VPVRGKNHGEAEELNDNVCEKELELAVQPSPEHEAGNCHLQYGMRNPERVIEDLDFLAHFLVAGKLRLLGSVLQR